MKIFSKIPLLFVLIAAISSCGKNDDFSDIPHLEWKDAEIEEDSGNRRNLLITVYFTDGDGNIGYGDHTAYDTCNAQSYDLQVFYFEKVDGSFVEVLPPDPCLPFHNRLPDIEPEGQNKTLEGDIFFPFDYNAFPQNANVDSVRFELQLIDRAGNKSELITSPAIFIPPL